MLWLEPKTDASLFFFFFQAILLTKKPQRPWGWGSLLGSRASRDGAAAGIHAVPNWRALPAWGWDGDGDGIGDKDGDGDGMEMGMMMGMGMEMGMGVGWRWGWGWGWEWRKDEGSCIYLLPGHLWLTYSALPTQCNPLLLLCILH